ncbi:hydrogen peroxide-inducible genes activator [Thiohalobacter sp. IOR34]|uniref:hydrogen peroxide-inducible genes activator n=1 Tax=Thiohalobacter sp. IOR34 TaxID=3057176 RepID=UPI0025B14714|nr:hydrogen peroxide-inducible genes activator [Thiohalobacter sp. IOR34]WJW74265.1 hydrogen peroxide-inducible genes activator [Thiohalobacter sp. IOR34]
MNIPELRYVVALARERHFGRAAAACFVTQPTLSVAIKKLEAELGVPLFERAGHEVRITPVGERVVEQAQQALESIEAVRQAAQQGRDPLSGPLRIGAIYTIGPYLFPELVPNLAELAPQMPLVVEENFTAVLAEKLRRGELDVIVISLPFSEPNILTLTLYEEPFVVLLPAAHPLTARKTLRSRDLETEPVLMLGSGHCFRDQVIEACPACASRSLQDEGLAFTVEGGSLETIRHMVASGMGLTVLPCTAAGADRYSQRLLVIRRFASPVPKRKVALAWRASFPRPQVIDVLKEAVARSGLSCVRSRVRRSRRR